MSYSKIALFIGGLIVIVAAIGGVAYLATTNKTPVPASETATTTHSGPGYTITALESSSLKDIQPDLDRPIAFGPSIPANVRAMIQAHIAEDVVSLKKDGTNAGDWLDLAIWYHAANDYESARLIWEFMVTAAPSDTTAYDNLGKLYHFDLHNFAKAEDYLKRSLAIKPDSATPYVELFELYSLSYKKDTTAAVDIMHAAEIQFPKDPGFAFTLGAYYRDRGDDKNARIEFLKAIDIARAEGKMDLLKQVNDELIKLDQ